MKKLPGPQLSLTADIGRVGQAGPVRQKTRPVKQHFALMELIVAIGIISIALFPLAYGLRQEGRNMKALYYRAVAEQVLDGQREILAAGAWRKYSGGQNKLIIASKAFENLPAGDLKLEVSELDGGKVRLVLSWKAIDFKGIGEIRKEATVTK